MITIIKTIVLLLISLSFAFAQLQSHPLSEIKPIDVNLDMFLKNIINVSYVGINTSYPLYPLHVIGSGIISSDLLVGNWINGTNFNVANQLCLGGICKTSWPGGISGSGTANYIPIWTAIDTLGNSIIYQSNSNIGIGTTTPGYTLDVNTTVNWGGARIVGSQNVQLAFEAPVGYVPQLAFLQGGIDRFTNFVASDGSYWAMGRFDDNGNYIDAPLAILRNSGNVGIGTISPTATLHISSTNPEGAINIVNATTGASLFLVNATTGNVGIGTTSPSYKLDVAGALRLQPSSAPTGANGVIYYDSSLNKFRCYQNGVWTDCITTITEPATGLWNLTGSFLYPKDLTWNVGIGTNTPTEKLEVQGRVLVASSNPFELEPSDQILDVKGSINATGTIYGTLANNIVKTASIADGAVTN
ncbi:MAG: hypothetical protein QW633_03650, partial [Candidatus Aenigmatarchaeota archaeon]